MNKQPPLNVSSFAHVSVLLNELTSSLNLSPGGIALDATAGGGGHTSILLKSVGEHGRVLAIDQDARAIEHLKRAFTKEIATNQLSLIHQNFSSVRDKLKSEGVFNKINGICADLGVSSPQLDEAERGFSFSKEASLDMRMDQRQTLTASEIINGWDERALYELLKNYGEEPKAFHIAKNIIRRREAQSFKTTTELAGFIENLRLYPGPSRKHPATRVFQALRIAVNDELSVLSNFLSLAFEALAPQGRLSIISFHSMEDRIVKVFFKEKASSPLQKIHRDAPVSQADLEHLGKAKAKIIKPFPTEPTETEIESNPRARSAKLRVLEKLE